MAAVERRDERKLFHSEVAVLSSHPLTAAEACPDGTMWETNFSVFPRLTRTRVLWEFLVAYLWKWAEFLEELRSSVEMVPSLTSRPG